jgi:MerR family transcriptional regulator, heat shock protein HspR
MGSADALFVISVAARLVELHPTTLRKYERAGFVEPSRTGGNIRLYSTEDIARLRQIKYLVDEQGVNLSGVEIALELTHRLLELRRLLSQSRDGQKASNREAIRFLDEALKTLGAG